MNKIILIALSIAMVSTTSCNKNTVEPELGNLQVDILTSGYQVPWSIEVIGAEEFIFTERLGGLFHYQAGNVREIAGLPATVTVPFAGLVYGGYMEVSLHPRFPDNGWIYLAYVARDYRMTVSRFKIFDGMAENQEVVFRSNAFSIGSRIVWQDDDHFFVSQGLGGNPTPEPGAQDLQNDGGKIHRLRADGSIPDDNPLVGGASNPSSVWSWGHRDPQGLYYDKDSEILYAHEHGPLGGDEFNIIEKGGNYGWPLFSFGSNYDGSEVSILSEAKARETTVLPEKYWGREETLAPSGLLKLVDSNFPEWHGTFLIGALAPQNLVSYDPATKTATAIVKKLGRVRDFALLPDGNLLILLDAGSPNSGAQGRVVRLSPK